MIMLAVDLATIQRGPFLTHPLACIGMPPTIITLANPSFFGNPPLRLSSAPPVSNMPNPHRLAPPNHGRKILPPTPSISAARTAGLLENYDFAGVSQLVDIGGAHGAITAAIASRYAAIRCTCFDVCSAEQGANQMFAGSGVDRRCQFVGGDFFEDVPDGADTYLLSAILHDWDDDHCLQILRNCRRGIQEKGTLLVVDASCSPMTRTYTTRIETAWTWPP